MGFWDSAKGAIAGGLVGGPLGAYQGAREGIEDKMQRGEQWKDVNQSNYKLDPVLERSMRNNYNDLVHNSQNRQIDPAAVNQAKFAGAKGSPARQYQQQVGKMLMNEAHGYGPAQQMARLNAQQMADRGMKQQMAMAAGGRPGQGALAGRAAAMNSADIQSRAGEQAVMGGLAAQMGAQQMAGGHFQGMRGLDQNQSQFNAGQRNQMSQFNAAQGNQMNQFNTDARLRQMGLNDQRELEAMRQRLQMANMNQQGNMAYEQNRLNRYNIEMGTPTQFERELGMLSNFGQMAMTAGKGG